MKTKTAEINLVAGQTDVSVNVSLEAGQTVRMGAYVNGALPAQTIQIAVKDTSGRELVPKAHVLDYVPSASGANNYYDKFKDVSFKERNIVVEVTTAVALAADFTFQSIFHTIEQ